MITNGHRRRPLPSSATAASTTSSGHLHDRERRKGGSTGSRPSRGEAREGGRAPARAWRRRAPSFDENVLKIPECLPRHGNGAAPPARLTECRRFAAPDLLLLQPIRRPRRRVLMTAAATAAAAAMVARPVCETTLNAAGGQCRLCRVEFLFPRRRCKFERHVVSSETAVAAVAQQPLRHRVHG